ncbi:MAG: LamG domain-containing protein [Candidatus Jorgensenbacteria bacterium]
MIKKLPTTHPSTPSSGPRGYPLLTNRSGQSLIEIVVGLGIGALLIGAGSFAIFAMLRSNVSTEKYRAASGFSQELIDTARSFAGASWQNLYGLAKGSSTTYYMNASGTAYFVVDGEEGMLDNDVTNGLVARWGFDENSASTSTTTYDATGNNNNGTLTNSPARASSTCKMGNCINFNGTDNYVGVPEATGTLDITNALTFAAWIYPTSTASYRPIAAKIPPAYGSGYEFANSSGVFRTTLRTGAGNCDFINGALTLNAWQHVASVYNGSATSHYLNGTLSSSSAACAYGAAANNNDLYLGGRASDASRFAGVIDDVRLYNRALSADEVQRLYNSGIYKRFFAVENVCRTDDASSTIAGTVPCSGTSEDSSTEQITVRTQWTAGAGTGEVKIVSFITRAQNAVFQQTDWSGGSGASGAYAAAPSTYASGTNVSTSTPGSIQIQNLTQQ